MEGRDFREIISKNFKSLVKVTVLGDELWNKIENADLFEDSKKLIQIRKNVKEQGEQLYLHLLRTEWTDDQIEQFRSALNTSGNAKALNLICGEQQGRKRQLRSPSLSDDEAPELDSANEVQEDAEIVEEITTWEEHYKMKAESRGLVLIINNENFKSKKLHRKGSEKDRDRLENVFKDLLKFEVITKSDLKRSDMKKAIKEFSQNPDHKSGSMCVLAIMSHGEEKAIFSSDNKKLEVNWILEQFNNNQSPFLKGKPKFFIFQACRGGKYDVSNLETREQIDAIPIDPSEREISWHVDIDPKWEDMIIAFSSIDGYVCYRNPENGSWFIQCLCQVLEKHAISGVSLRDMLDQVAWELKKRKSIQERETRKLFSNSSEISTYLCKQSCCYLVIHLYKKIYFKEPPKTLSLQTDQQ